MNTVIKTIFREISKMVLRKATANTNIKIEMFIRVVLRMISRMTYIVDLSFIQAQLIKEL